MNGKSRGVSGRPGGEESCLPNTVNVVVTNRMDDAQFGQLRTEISGFAFALVAVARSLHKKLDAIAEKIQNPDSNDLSTVIAALKSEADSLEEIVRKHQPTE